jgi:hypothetical protein
MIPPNQNSYQQKSPLPNYATTVSEMGRGEKDYFSLESVSFLFIRDNWLAILSYLPAKFQSKEYLFNYRL